MRQYRPAPTVRDSPTNDKLAHVFLAAEMIGFGTAGAGFFHNNRQTDGKQLGAAPTRRRHLVRPLPTNARLKVHQVVLSADTVQSGTEKYPDEQRLTNCDLGGHLQCRQAHAQVR